MKWREIVKVALLGTDRSGLLAREDDASPEPSTQLLRQAVLKKTEQTAGFPLKKITPSAVAQSRENAQDTIPPNVQVFLERILDGTYENALPEALSLLEETNKKIPAYLLPEIMKCLDTKLVHWKQIQPALGQEAQWLLQQHPSWKNHLYYPVEKDWYEGPFTRQLLFFKATLCLNPAKALEYLKTSWPDQTEKEKLEYTRIIARTPGGECQAFLELLLSHENKKFRQMAASALVKNPDSVVAQKLEDYIQSFFPNKKNTLDNQDLTFSAEANPDLKHWGLQTLKTKYTAQKGKDMLAQAISKVRPEFLEDTFELTPSRILSQVRVNTIKWMPVFAILDSTLHHKSPLWAEALLNLWLKDDYGAEFSSFQAKKLLNFIDQKALNRILIQHLKKREEVIPGDSPVFFLLTQATHHWEDELSLLVLLPFQQWLANSSGFMAWTMMHYKELLKRAAFRVNPSLLASMEQSWVFQSRTAYQWENEVEDFIKILRFRKVFKKMLQEAS